MKTEEEIINTETTLYNDKKIKGGSFKTLNLNKQLLYNIPFTNPTPIQRKIIPLILEQKSVMGIGRTGSGKTYCYLIPAIQKALSNKNVLILVPTRELVNQVNRNKKYLTRNIELEGEIEVTTPGRFNNENRNFKVDLFVVDEIDRIIEENDLKKEFDILNDTLECQKVFFSATKPDIHVDCKIVEVDAKINENVEYTFYYMPSISKESVLLNTLQNMKKNKLIEVQKETEKIGKFNLKKKSKSIKISSKDKNDIHIFKNKIIIFVSTKYTVDYLLEILSAYNYTCRGIYSSMDNQARLVNYKDFTNGFFNILVVTDVAARGLDIPLLDVVINYDLSDERTFLHRVGRIRGMGSCYSFVTYNDIFHFFNIQETYLKDVEIGLVPSNILDEYDLSKYLYLKAKTEKGYEKCLKFRSKVSVPDEYKDKINKMELHTNFRVKDSLCMKLQKHLNKSKKKEIIKQSDTEDGSKFRDQFYIPYSRKDSKIHSSAFGVMKDDYVIEKKEKFKYKRARMREKKSK
ncbi:hypothetical protein P3W45_001823 [Vairimorpha bombi]|jgi:ATP-dependent RNA helicase DDX54/DBP10